MRTVTFTRDNMEVPCDCPSGPCGWKHRAPGPSRYYIDGVEVTKDEAEECWRGLAT